MEGRSSDEGKPVLQSSVLHDKKLSCKCSDCSGNHALLVQEKRSAFPEIECEMRMREGGGRHISLYFAQNDNSAVHSHPVKLP